MTGENKPKDKEPATDDNGAPDKKPPEGASEPPSGTKPAANDADNKPETSDDAPGPQKWRSGDWRASPRQSAPYNGIEITATPAYGQDGKFVSALIEFADYTYAAAGVSRTLPALDLRQQWTDIPTTADDKESATSDASKPAATEASGDKPADAASEATSDDSTKDDPSAPAKGDKPGKSGKKPEADKQKPAAAKTDAPAEKVADEPSKDKPADGDAQSADDPNQGAGGGTFSIVGQVALQQRSTGLFVRIRLAYGLPTEQHHELGQILELKPELAAKPASAGA